MTIIRKESQIRRTIRYCPDRGGDLIPLANPTVIRKYTIGGRTIEVWVEDSTHYAQDVLCRGDGGKAYIIGQGSDDARAIPLLMEALTCLS